MVKKVSIIGKRNIIDLNKTDLEFISFVFLSKSKELFLNKSLLTKTNEGKWIELVYCILAGSQYPVNKLKIIFPKLFSDHLSIFELSSFKIINLNERREEIAFILKKLGYRYHSQKATTIVNTAIYFNLEYNGDIENFLVTNSSVSIVRNTLIKEISGIGIKIASHWLRNIGYPVCTIDIHLRRLLFNLDLTNENPESSLNNSDFIILENIFKEWSEILNTNLGVLQYSIWEYTREYCAPLNCGKCPLLKICKRGHLFTI